MSAEGSDDRAARDLASIADADSAAAPEAMERLWRLAHPTAVRAANRVGVAGDEALDVAQAAFEDLWRYRTEIRARSLPAWLALVGTAARRDAIDLLRSLARAGSRLDESVAGEVRREPGEAVDGAERLRDLLAAADRLWLGVPRSGRDEAAGTRAGGLAIGLGLDPIEVAARMGVD